MSASLRRITPVYYRDLIRVLELDGWAVNRVRGDHGIMTKPGMARPVVIKVSPREVPVTHIRTNLTIAGISRDRYFDFLAQIA